jgi:hypothetical protein
VARRACIEAGFAHSLPKSAFSVMFCFRHDKTGNLKPAPSRFDHNQSPRSKTRQEHWTGSAPRPALDQVLKVQTPLGDPPTPPHHPKIQESQSNRLKV